MDRRLESGRNQAPPPRGFPERHNLYVNGDYHWPELRTPGSPCVDPAHPSTATWGYLLDPPTHDYTALPRRGDGGRRCVTTGAPPSEPEQDRGAVMTAR